MSNLIWDEGFFRIHWCVEFGLGSPVYSWVYNSSNEFTADLLDTLQPSETAAGDQME